VFICFSKPCITLIYILPLCSLERILSTDKLCILYNNKSRRQDYESAQIRWESALRKGNLRSTDFYDKNVFNECATFKANMARLHSNPGPNSNGFCNSSTQIFISFEYEKQTELLSKKFEIHFCDIFPRKHINLIFLQVFLWRKLLIRNVNCKTVWERGCKEIYNSLL
jgi:hypothetical protein